jgi:hypothetical protein
MSSYSDTEPWVQLYLRVGERGTRTRQNTTAGGIRLSGFSKMPYQPFTTLTVVRRPT